MANKVKLSIGNDDFRSFVLESDIFVDKSFLLEEIIEGDAKVLLITRPRRWGLKK